MKRLIPALALLSLVAACSEEGVGASLDKVDLNLYSAADDRPFDGVAFLRIAVDRRDGTNVFSKFVSYQKTLRQALEGIPFGSGLLFTVEGWTQDPTNGKLGALVSRGRSQPIDVAQSSGKARIDVLISRVNAFAWTTDATPGKHVATGLQMGRIGHSVTKLRDGRVLILGGATLKATANGDIHSPSDIATVYANGEIYNPRTGQFTPVAGAMDSARAFHTATLMPDGTVLVLGGVSATGDTLPLWQVFDPATMAFRPTATTALTESRAGHTATLVDDVGHVLVVGGFGRDQAGNVTVRGSVEVITPVQAGVKIAELQEPRYFHTATRVTAGPATAPRDSLLLVGGESVDAVRGTAELYVLFPSDAAGLDPTLYPMAAGPRTRHTATLVSRQGFVHVVGGYADKARASVLDRVDSFQLDALQFQTAVDFRMFLPRAGHTAVLLAGDVVFVSGGFQASGPVAPAEVIFEGLNKATGGTEITKGQVDPGLRQPRGGHAAVVLDNGTVLTVGGVAAGSVAVTAGELFNPF